MMQQSGPCTRSKKKCIWFFFNLHCLLIVNAPQIALPRLDHVSSHVSAKQRIYCIYVSHIMRLCRVQAIPNPSRWYYHASTHWYYEILLRFSHLSGINTAVYRRSLKTNKSISEQLCTHPRHVHVDKAILASTRR